MKGNVINLNTLHLNSVRLNGIGKVQSVSLKGGSTEDPVFPPVEPPIEPEPTPTYTLSASVTNGMVSATRNGSTVNLPYTANEGDVIVVEVTPNDGYEFNGWNDGNTDNPRTITMNADVALSAQCVEVVQPPVGNYIQFEDKAVEAICVANWSSDGIGLTEEDAAKVTSIGTTFKGNTDITSFGEFKYFKKCTTLVASAFEGCTSLTKLNIEHIEVMNNRALYGCTALNYDYLNLANLVTLGGNALYGVKVKRLNLSKLSVLPTASTSQRNYGDPNVLEEVVLADNAKTIPAYSFWNYSVLHTCNIPKGITTIGDYALASTSLSVDDLNLPNLETIGIGAFRQTRIKKVSNLGKIVSIPNGADANQGSFANCTDLTSVNIPTTCTTIGNRAFMKCNSLNEVTMGNVTRVGVAAFSYTGFEEFIFPDSVTTIGLACFYECPNLKKIVIGSSITSIGTQLAQTNGSIMEAVICRATTPPSIYAETYKGTNVCPIYVPDASVEAYKTAINWTAYASRIKGMSEYNG